MLIIFIFGNMFISIMVQIKFDGHILSIIGVYWMVSKVYNVCLLGDYNIYSQFQFSTTRHNYIIKSLTGVKSYRGSSCRVNS